MQNQDSRELAIREALSSTRGLSVTPDIEQNIRRILSGEITLDQRVREIRKKQV